MKNCLFWWILDFYSSFMYNHTCFGNLWFFLKPPLPKKLDDIQYRIHESDDFLYICLAINLCLSQCVNMWTWSLRLWICWSPAPLGMFKDLRLRHLNGPINDEEFQLSTMWWRKINYNSNLLHGAPPRNMRNGVICILWQSCIMIFASKFPSCLNLADVKGI